MSNNLNNNNKDKTSLEEKKDDYPTPNSNDVKVLIKPDSIDVYFFQKEEKKSIKIKLWQSLDLNKSRFTFTPIRDPVFNKLYQDHIDMFWTKHELDLSEDSKDLEKMLPEERSFLRSVLLGFNIFDHLVIENDNDIIDGLKEENLLTKEKSFLYTWIESIEQIHAEVYSLIFDNLFPNNSLSEILYDYDSLKNQDRNSVDNILEINSYCEEFFESLFQKIYFMKPPPEHNTDNLLEKMVRNLCAEGIFFQPSFVAIFYFKEKNLCKGLAQANDFIARDEEHHCQVGIAMVKFLLEQGFKSDKLGSLIDEAELIECKFAFSIFKSSLIKNDCVYDIDNMIIGNLSFESVRQYVFYVCDRIRGVLNLPLKHAEIKICPIPFMSRMGVEEKVNFFEKKVTNYKPPKDTDIKEW